MLPRFSHLLVPVDLTSRNSAALEIAFELAVENKASVSLLHVIQTIDSGNEPADSETQKFYDHLHERVASDMDRIAQRFQDAGLKVESKIRVGDRLRDIVAFAEEHAIDLIVMSSHRIDPEDPIASWGTLSYKVSVVCECPILLVK